MKTGFRKGRNTDEDLMKRVQNGSEAALNLLLIRYRPLLYYFFLRRTQDHDDSEDLVQTTLMRVFRARNRYQPDFRVSTWIYTIARNQLINHYRKQTVRTSGRLIQIPNLDQPDQGITIPNQEMSPAEHTEAQLFNRDFDLAVKQLPDGYGIPLKLRDKYGLSYREIRLATGLLPGTIKSRISRARKKLQKLLKVFRDE